MTSLTGPQFLNSTGVWDVDHTGWPVRPNPASDLVDLWIGGLAEATEPFGGMLGSTFNFVFEEQMEDLQDGDRFYYLGRTAGLNFLTQLEQNSFAGMIARNTDIEASGWHLPGDIFASMHYILEVDQSVQFNEGMGSADPTDDGSLFGMDLWSSATIHEHCPEPIPGFLQFTGGDHVVHRRYQSEQPDQPRPVTDHLIGGIGDDTIWGDGGDDINRRWRRLPTSCSAAPVTTSSPTSVARTTSRARTVTTTSSPAPAKT